MAKYNKAEVQDRKAGNFDSVNSLDYRSRILVVEDESHIAFEIADQLEHLGYTVLGPLNNGEQSLELARRELPDLIIFDIRLAGEMDGIEAARIIRAELGTPVIYLTSHADDRTLTRAQITEPYGYVLKPFSELELQTAVKLALLKANGSQAPLLEPAIFSSNKQMSRRVSARAKKPVAVDKRILGALKDTSHFKLLDDQTLERLSRDCSLEQVSKGQMVIFEGDRHVSSFLVCSGCLAMVKSSASGKDFTVELLPAGDTFGIGVALAWSPYPVTVKAQVDSELLWIPPERIQELFEVSPDFAKKIIQEVFERLRLAHSMSRGLAHDRTDVRVATALLALAPKFSVEQSEPSENCVPMTREQLASFIGCATETVVRVTKAMEREHLLDLSKRGRIGVVDSAALKDLAEAEC